MLTVPEQDDPREALKAAVNNRNAGGTTPFDTLLNATSKKAQEIDPSLAGRILQQQIKTGIDKDLIAGHLDEVERDSAASDFNPTEYRKRNPKMARWLAESPYHVATVKDPEAQKALNDLERVWFRKDDLARPLSDEEIGVRIEREVARRTSMAKALDTPLPSPGGEGLRSPGMFEIPQGPEAKKAREASLLKSVREESEKSVRDREAYIAGTSSRGVSEVLSDPAAPSILERIPMLSGIMETIKSGRLYEAAKAVENGGGSDDDRDLLLDFARLNAATERRGTSFMGGVADIIAGSATFATEVAATGGSYTAAKAGIQKTIRGAVKNVVSGRTGTLAVKAAGSVAGVAAQLPAQATPRIVAGVLSRMSPGTEIEEADGGLRIKVDQGSGKSWYAAIPPAVGEAFAELLSERAGGGISNVAPQGKVANLLFGSWKKTNKGGTLEAFGTFTRKAGINGVLSEIGEEEFGKVLKSVISDSPAYAPPLTSGGTTGGELLQQAAAFGFIPAVGVASGSFETRRAKARAKELTKIFEKAGLDVDALEKAGVPMPVIKNMVGVATKGTKAESVYLDVDAVLQAFDGEVDEAGAPIDARVALGKALGSTKDFDLAAVSGAPLRIPTTEYMTNPLLREKRAKLDKKARLDPNEMNEEEAEAFFQSRQDEEKATADIEAKVDTVLSEKEPEIQKKAIELAKQEAKASLAALMESDVIAQLEARIGRRIFWNREGRTAEELSQSGVPKHLIADPSTAKERGSTYATPADEAAATLGFASDEDLIKAIADAAKARKDAEDASASEFVDDRYYQGVVERERAKARADLTGQPGAFYEQAGADVREKLAAQFMAAGYSPDQANAYANLGEAFFRTQGIRSQIDPEEIYRALNLRIQKEGPRKAGALEQPSEMGKDPLGSYSPASLPGRPTIINILKKANLSTALHEMGHLYLDVLVDLSSMPSATAGLKSDLQKVMDWFGVKDVEAWKALDIEGKRPHHEKWATSFESYLRDGKAPSSTLRAMFDRFKAWLLSVYRNLRGLPELNPEIREVFDRMLATEEEIAHAEREQNAVPIDPKALKLSESDEAAYVEAIEKARARAVSELGTTMLRNVLQAQTAAYKELLAKVKAEIAAEEVDVLPVYNARAALKDNTYPDGEPREGEPIKLDAKAITDRYGKDRLKGKLSFLHTKEGGLHPDVVAEMFGYSSGDELLTALEAAEPRKALIDRLAKERMEQEYGPAPASAEIAEAAVDALHNEARGDLLALEARKIAQAAGQKATPRAILKAYAARHIAGQRWLDIQPNMYRRAEAKASREAFEAAGKGAYPEALAAKQREMLNHELYRESVKARDEMRDKAESLKRFMKDSVRATIGKAGGDYLDQIDDLMERFDFGTVSGRQVERRKSLAAWVLEQEQEGNPVEIDPEILSDAFRKHWKDLTPEEFQKVADAIDNIAHLALLKDRLLKDAKKRAVSEVIDGGVASILENSRGPKKRVKETRRPGQERKDRIAGFLASHRKLSSLVREMDGWKDGGFLWDVVVRPINEAADAEASRNAEATKRLAEIFAIIKDSKVSGKVYIPEIEESLDRESILTIALNWGNEDSRQKLMDGYKWTEAQVVAILDHLTEAEWKFVREVWGYINEFWPEIAALNKRSTGLEPEKVEASPFMTKFGEVEGGYFPLAYDERQSERAGAKVAEDAAERMMRGGAVRATTRHGHRKARVSGVKQPVRLDFGVIFSHVQSVIHDLTHYEMLHDVNRIVRSNRMQDAIRDHYGHEVYQQLKSVLDDIATGDAPARTAFEKGMKAIRVGTSVAAMGWNVTTALMQPMGITQSMVRVGPKWIARGLRAWLGSPKHMSEMVEYVYEKSEFMRNRGRTQQREINEVRNSIGAGKLSKVQDSFFWMISTMQKVVDVPTWLGAYEKARADEVQEEGQTEGELDARAIQIANQAVIDAQGGGQVKDLSQVQRGGPLMKLFSQFYGFFSTTYQLAVESGKKSSRDKSPGRLATDFLLLFIVPATLGHFLKMALKGGGDDDNEMLEKLLRANASYLAGTMVGLRELSGAIEGFHQYTGPAGARWFASINKAYGQAEQGEIDGALLDSLNETAGILFQYPAGQVERTVRGVGAIVNGETKNPAAVLFGAPRK